MAIPLENNRAPLSLEEVRKEAESLQNLFLNEKSRLNPEVAKAVKLELGQVLTLIEDYRDDPTSFSQGKFDALRTSIEEKITAPTATSPTPAEQTVVASTVPEEKLSQPANASETVAQPGEQVDLPKTLVTTLKPPTPEVVETATGEAKPKEAEEWRPGTNGKEWKTQLESLFPVYKAHYENGDKRSLQKPWDIFQRKYAGVIEALKKYDAVTDLVKKAEASQRISKKMDELVEAGEAIDRAVERTQQTHNLAEKPTTPESKQAIPENIEREKKLTKKPEIETKNPDHGAGFNPQETLKNADSPAIREFLETDQALRELSYRLGDRKYFPDAEEHAKELEQLLLRSASGEKISTQDRKRALFLQRDLERIVRVAEKDLAREAEKQPEPPPSPPPAPEINYDVEERYWHESSDKKILKFKILDGEILELEKKLREFPQASKVHFEEAGNIASNLSFLLWRNSLGKLSKEEQKLIPKLSKELVAVKKKATAELRALRAADRASKAAQKAARSKSAGGSYSPVLALAKNIETGGAEVNLATLTPQAAQMQAEMDALVSAQKNSRQKEVAAESAPSTFEQDLEADLKKQIGDREPGKEPGTETKTETRGISYPLPAWESGKYTKGYQEWYAAAAPFVKNDSELVPAVYEEKTGEHSTYSEEYLQWLAVHAEHSKNDEELTPEAYTKDTQKSPFEESAPLLLNKLSKDNFYSKEDFRLNEARTQTPGLTVEYQGDLAALEMMRQSYVKEYQKATKEWSAKGKIARIKESLTGQKIDLEKPPADHSLYRARQAYEEARIAWLKTRLNEALMVYGGASETSGESKQKDSTQRENVYEEFVFKERSTLNALKEVGLTAQEKGIFRTYLEMYAKSNALTKGLISVALVSPLALAAVSTGVLAIPAAALWLTKRGLAVTTGASVGAMTGQVVGKGLEKWREADLKKLEAKDTAIGRERAAKLGQSDLKSFLKEADAVHQETDTKKTKRLKRDALVKAGAVVISGIAAGQGSAALADALAEQMSSVGASPEIKKTGTKVYVEQKTEVTQKIPPKLDTYAEKEPDLGESKATTAGGLGSAVEAGDSTNPKPKTIGGLGGALEAGEESLTKTLAGTGEKTFSVEIKAGGNIWNSTQELIRGNPTEFGWTGDGTPDQKWLTKETAKILQANPDAAKNNLVHAGDKVLLQKQPGGGIKLSMDYASGLKSGVLDTSSQDVPIPEKVEVESFTAVPETKPTDDIPRNSHVTTGRGAMINDLGTAAAAEANLKGRLDDLFGVKGFFVSVAGADSPDWARLKGLKARDLILALQSSDPEMFKLPGTSNTLDAPKLRLAQALKEGIDKTGMQPGKDETADYFLFTLASEEVSKLKRLATTA